MFQQPIKYLRASILVLLVSILNYYRSTYNNLERLYEHFGQFQYLDQRDPGKIYTKVDEDGSRVWITSIIKEKYCYFFRSIKVYEEGKIKEEEWSDWSGFIRIREIYQSGYWEEYSVDYNTGFGIRKVVYPDGKQFTGEVYGLSRWNAIGEETYAILNESTPYLLRNNETGKYKYVTKDGSFEIINLRRNDK